MQHPLEPAIQCKIQTRSANPGPAQAVEAALGSLQKEFDKFEKQFNEGLKKKQAEQRPGGGLGAGVMDIDDL